MVFLPIPQIMVDHVKNGTEFGKSIKAALTDDGKVSDVPLTHFVIRELKNLGDKSFIITGFPKTYRQAILLWKDIEFNFVINLEYPSEHLISVTTGDTAKTVPEEKKREKIELATQHILNYQKKAAPLIKFYQNQKVLYTFYSNTEEGMWEKVKKGVENHIGTMSKT